MNKFTYKKEKHQGQYSSFNLEHHDIKIKKKICGSIDEVRNAPPDRRFSISFAVVDPAENCGWKWIRMKARFENADAAREWLNEMIEPILKRYNLHKFED